MRIFPFIFVLCFLTSIWHLGFTQSTVSVEGRIVDSLGNPLPAATIRIKLDTLTVMAVQSDLSGRFKISFKPSHYDYQLSIQLLGFRAHLQTFKLLKDQKVADFGDVVLWGSSILLDDIAIIQDIPIRIKGDTIIYNASSFGAYKNDEIARLLRLLPGFEEDVDGRLKARGKEIGRLTVNGEDFYKGDPTKAMQMLRVDMVKTVELIEERSEASRLSGIDDGQRIARVNLILKPDWREMYFGNIAGSGGSNERYEGSFNGNRFVGGNQLGLQWSRSNMNNQGMNQSSSHSGLSGSEGFLPRFGAGGISVSNKAGGTAAYRFGQNKWYRLNTHYSFESLANDVLQQSFITDHLFENSSQQFEQLEVNRHVKSHKWNLEQEMTISKFLSLRILSDLNVYDVQETTLRNWEAGELDQPNRSSLFHQNQQNRWSPFGTFSTYLSYKIPKMKTNLDFSFLANKSSQELLGSNQLNQQIWKANGYLDSGFNQLNNQMAGSDGIHMSLNATYQFSDTPYLQLNFVQSFSRQNQQDRQATLQFNPLTGLYDIHLPQLSNQMDLSTNKWSSALGSSYSKGKWYGGASFAVVMMQQTGIMHHLQPQDQQIQRNSVYLAPNGFMNYRLSPQSYIQVMSNVIMTQPMIHQLIPVINNSNPMFLTIGNPKLRNTTHYNTTISYSHTNPRTMSTRFLSGMYNINALSVSTSITVDPETLVQTLHYINVPLTHNGWIQWNQSFSFQNQWKFLNLSYNARYALNQRSNHIYNQMNRYFQQSMSGGVSIRVNKAKIIASLNNQITYTDVQNSYQMLSTQNYYLMSHLLSLDFRPYERWRFQVSGIRQSYFGFSSYENVQLNILNSEISYNGLKNQKLIFTLAANDLLNQNRNVVRMISQTGRIEDQWNNNLARYFYLKLTYRLDRKIKND